MASETTETTPAAAEPAPQSTEPKVEAATIAEAPEPQNVLTEKFTDDEWKAIKELRGKLSDVLKDAEPDSTSATIWGVTLDPSKPDARQSVVLLKFLKARNMQAGEAATMLTETLKWRAEWNIDAIMKEEFPQDVYGPLGHIYGTDKLGHPVVYNVYGTASKDLERVFGDVKRFLRWRIQFMEKAVAMLNFETLDQMIQVHDYDGVSLLSSRDANSKEAAREASSIFQNHYPELLYKKFFVNVPSFLTWIYWIFKNLVNPRTLAKMQVVGTGPGTISSALLPFIDAKELPTRYGGEASGF